MCVSILTRHAVPCILPASPEGDGSVALPAGVAPPSRGQHGGHGRGWAGVRSQGCGAGHDSTNLPHQSSTGAQGEYLNLATFQTGFRQPQQPFRQFKPSIFTPHFRSARYC